MPSRKKRDWLCVRAFQSFDMFGYQIGFNINGEDSHTTSAGSCVSLFIFAWIGVILHYLIRDIVMDTLDRPLTIITYPNYFGPTNQPISTKDGFKFAVGVSSVKNF